MERDEEDPVQGTEFPKSRSAQNSTRYSRCTLRDVDVIKFCNSVRTEFPQVFHRSIAQILRADPQPCSTTHNDPLARILLLHIRENFS
jgi:hypothetical protein